ncbi:hypothetical protein G6F65_021018 [Rhizopus arrhizus]|nr:hypothetical protein G6F65_021018 [Rhizopus arrhizus]
MDLAPANAHLPHPVFHGAVQGAGLRRVGRHSKGAQPKRATPQGGNRRFCARGSGKTVQRHERGPICRGVRRMAPADRDLYAGFCPEGRRHCHGMRRRAQAHQASSASSISHRQRCFLSVCDRRDGDSPTHICVL